MKKIFDELSYKHYRKKNWVAMLHTALRMRVEAKLSSEIADIFDADISLAKEFFRINKQLVVKSLCMLEQKIPINMDNIIYLWNYVSVGSEKISEITPDFLLDNFARDLARL
ncbi:hypothetical protein HAV22_17180 [Massilia sp. TW-1]|uniref:Uncharacterized protein n=1 Tax=Telluria antibiotica TaxID=2717319 RepID=A0ABX0PDD4_9BURK|nr:hypothetical protein [Telluria antibiotica]NIA55371.1 hypothetical protein [Telluria antibiotica]